MRLAQFTLSAASFAAFGRNLHRPECVWVDADGVWASDARGGVCRVRPDREPEVLGAGDVPGART